MSVVINIHLLARASELGKTTCLQVQLDDPATVAALRKAIARAAPALVDLLPACAIAVNHQYAHDEETIPIDAEVALLPPVSGG